MQLMFHVVLNSKSSGRQEGPLHNKYIFASAPVSAIQLNRLSGLGLLSSQCWGLTDNMNAEKKTRWIAKKKKEIAKIHVFVKGISLTATLMATKKTTKSKNRWCANSAMTKLQRCIETQDICSTTSNVTTSVSIQIHKTQKKASENLFYSPTQTPVRKLIDHIHIPVLLQPAQEHYTWWTLIMSNFPTVGLIKVFLPG